MDQLVAFCILVIGAEKHIELRVALLGKGARVVVGHDDFLIFAAGDEGHTVGTLRVENVEIFAGISVNCI